MTREAPARKKFIRTYLNEVALVLFTENGDSPQLSSYGRARLHWACALGARETVFWGAEDHVADARAGIE